MHRPGLLLAAITAATIAEGSGVGASYFVAGNATPSVVQASCETCGPMANCPGCQRLGFAGVDNATPPPCTAEGGCHPARASFGYYAQRWRRWPGTTAAEAAPETATEEDSLLPPFDAPRAEEEDQRAPPPIEDVDAADGPQEDRFEGGHQPDGPGLEITLPPLPDEGFEAPRPAAPQFREGPPELPFGFVPSEEREPVAKPVMIDAGRWSAPQPPFSSTTSRKLGKARTATSTPPPPPAFASKPNRRYDRRDSAVRAASAVERLPEWRR